MASEQTRSDVTYVLAQIEQERDTRQAYIKIQQQLEAYRQRGDAVPSELLHMEKDLALACCSESQGR